MSATNLDSKYQSQELYLDSNYGLQNTTNNYNSDVYFFFQSPIICSSDHDIVLRVENFTCPISFFLINAFNNTLNFSINGVNQNIQITTGNYNALSLTQELNTLLTPFNFTVVYDANQNKFTFTNAVNTFIFLSTSTCFNLLGFQRGVNHTSSIARVLTSQFIVNLSGTSLIYIDIPNITTKNISSRNDGGFTTIVKSVIQNTEFGGILSYVNNTNSAVVLKEKYMSYLQVRLLDDDYNLLDLQGQNFVLTLEIFYYYNGTKPLQSFDMLDVMRNQEEMKQQILNRK